MGKKKKIQNYFDNYLFTKEKMGGKMIPCICGNLDPNCKSECQPEK